MPDFGLDFNTLNHLDKTRYTEGNDNLNLQFRSIAKEKPYEAVRLLNDEKLHFTSLFALRSAINDLGLYRHLNYRNMVALKLTRKILDRIPANIASLPKPYKQKIHPVLKWMFETSYLENSLDTRHEEIIDITVSMLIKLYRDNSILHKLTDIIFQRHKRGASTYDLIWILFESGDPEVLVMISDRLKSSDEKDVKLANKLLRFIPCNDQVDIQNQNAQRINWIRDNYPYLYYTGESLHQSCNPIPFAVSLEAKYLCKPISSLNREFKEPLSREEKNILAQFSALDDFSKEVLAELSSNLNENSRSDWNSWLRTPIGEQIIQSAKLRGELL